MKEKILDHGYVELIEHWGSDERIIESARMSTGGGFVNWNPYWSCNNCGTTGPLVDGHPSCSECCTKPDKVAKKKGDAGLLSYLWRKRHTSPFEMCGMTIEVCAPIFVYRQWHRHRTQSYNEMSSRYAPLPDFNYVPTIDRLLIGGGHLTKQAGRDAEINQDALVVYREKLEEHYRAQQELYDYALSVGVPKELARIHIGVGRYSTMRATGNLLNWFRFLGLRLPEEAQWEIRQYAEALNRMAAYCFPRSLALFDKKRL
jgi:thymidylate synthase (FAD)